MKRPTNPSERDTREGHRLAAITATGRNLVESTARATVIELCSWRTSGTDAANNLVAELDHHTTAEEHYMRYMTGGRAVTSETRTTDLTYPWPRFWVPRGGVIDLSDAGFLRDPADWMGSSHAPVPLAVLQGWRSLALLGEPGIGKSTTLREEADRVAALSADANLASI